MPIPTTLFPALHGYRRGLFSGRAVSVYYDRHPRNEWAAHSREEDQISAILDRAVCTLKWKPVGSDWCERELQGPAAWLIPAGTPHALVCPAPTDMVTLFIDGTYADAMAAGRNSGVTIADLDYLTGRDALIGQLTKEFRGLCGDPVDPDAIYVESIGTLFASHLLRGLVDRREPTDRRNRLPPDALQRVTRYVEDHLAEPLALASLARVAGFSASHFGRLFKASAGMTPHDYVMHRRVARAESLLQGSDKKELEIAFLCGFSDDTLMSRWFRRVLTCRPSEIRAQRPR